MSMAQSSQGKKGRGSRRHLARTSQGTAGKGACTSLGGQEGRRRSGIIIFCEPAVVPPAAAMVKPGQVRCDLWEGSGTMCWEDGLWIGTGEWGGRRRSRNRAHLCRVLQPTRFPFCSIRCVCTAAMQHIAAYASWHVILHASPLAAASLAHVPVSPGKELAAQSGASSISGSTEDIPSAIRSKELAGIFQQKIFLDYSTYMAQFVPAETGSSPEQSPPHSTLGSPAATKVRTQSWMQALSRADEPHALLPPSLGVHLLLKTMVGAAKLQCRAPAHGVPTDSRHSWLLPTHSSVKTQLGAVRAVWPG